MTIPNTTYRVLVEKLGAQDASQFIGNEGEVFYDPNNPLLKLSDGTTAGGLSIGGAGGGNDSRISSTQISHWDTAYGWGDHSTAGYISSITAGSGVSIDEVGGQVTISATGAGASTGDVTFSGNQVIGFGTGSGDGNGYSTLELVPDSNFYGGDQYIIVDPTGPNHIHLRAGGTQDNSYAQLFLGGEKNHVSVLDGTGVRLYNEETNGNSSYYSDGTHFTSATWASDGSGGGWVEFTTTDPNLINGTFNAGTVEIATVEQGTVQLVYTGATSLGGDVYRIYSQNAPSPDPQTVTNINITLYTTYENEVYLQAGDFRVDVRDDVRIIGSDIVSLRNNSETEPVTIIADNNNSLKTWQFKPNGNLEFPDGNIQTTGITDAKITDWDTAYGWGDHSTAGYISSTSTSYAQTLIVDPNGNDTTANGGPNAPFQTVQAAHDYADANIPVADQVIVKLNGGSYAGNLLVTRPNIHFVGPTYGSTKSTRISGIVTVSTASSVGGAASDMITFENILIASNSGTSAVTIGGTFGCSVMFKDAYVYTSSSTAKCVDVTNTASSGVKVEMKNVVLQNQLSSGITLDLSNTHYANIDLLTIYGGTNSTMKVSTTDAIVYNTKFESSGVSTSIYAISSFNPGKPALVLGNATITNATANASGIDIAAGAITNVAQVAFNVGIATGTGFAVKGVLGSVFVNGNNLIVPGSNNKVSSAIGAGNIPLGTSLTPA